ncbi:MAG: sulfotransferase [Sulfitobacter sp.]
MTTPKPPNTPLDLKKYGKTVMSLRYWHGMTLAAWLRAMKGHWHRVPFSRYPLVAVITLFSIGNQFLAWTSELLYGRKLAQVKIEPDPIFVIGHWRSGTTWLHHMLMLDARHAAPEVHACFRPETFLVARGFATKIMGWLLPPTRPMDDVPLLPENAEEDEHGISLSGAPSNYRSKMFPSVKMDVPYSPEDMNAADAALWREKWLAFLKRVQFINPGKRLVLKSPTHTVRTGEILRHFPNAKFVHIVRDPYKIFLSARKSAIAMHTVSTLQDHLPPQSDRDNGNKHRFVRFHARFEKDRENIPEDQLVMIKYEDLRADPVKVIGEVYQGLGLGQFEDVAPEIARHNSGAKPYQNNQYELDEAMREQVEAACGSYFETYGYLPMAERPVANP